METELLAPAGNYVKFKTALYYGADAAYIGGKNFSLRTFADNFGNNELEKAITEAHALKKKVYVAVNVFAKNADFPMLKEYFEYLEAIGADAAIISDPGAVYLSKKVAPKLPVHISTQANTTNKYSVKFWSEQGAERVILARELSLKEIAEIRDFVPEIELEAFVHGAMCISYSGRCLLSDYLDGRSSNRGACVQACRWRYEIRATNPTNGETGWLDISEDKRGTYILNSKDLNMLSELDNLKKAGVNSFKIEGRMKSEYYLATVINAYRRVLDLGYTIDRESELQNIAHREYTKAYAYGENTKTENHIDGQTKGKYTFIASVLGSSDGYVKAEMRNRFKTGDVLEVLSPNENYKKSFTVEEILDGTGNRIDDAKLVQSVYRIKCPYTLSAGDFLRRSDEQKKELRH